ncbi:MAG: GNAT family N-acetyltransferase [Acetobacterium sp.]
MNKLIWDSNFWGIELFSISENSKCWDQDSFLKIQKRDKLWLIQGLISENEVDNINCFENKGFRFVESKITLKNKVTKRVNISEDQFKNIEKCELAEFKDDFYNLYGKFSRFSLFPEEKINDFYYAWMINSIDGTMDDACIGYYINRQLAGFITYKNEDNRLLIGLVGVFPKFRKQGISQKLLGYANNSAINQGCGEILVSTQGKNSKAINAYIKSGFIFESIKQWYYLTNYKSL